MKSRKEYRFTLIWIILYASAMALLEAVVVVYLRELYYPDHVQVLFPITIFTQKDLIVELSREVATIVMIFSVAVLLEKKQIIRVFACFVLLFGLWDIFYYIWLKVFINWPLYFCEWDILFLIPWAWFGPWICPVLISLLFILWGGSVLLRKDTISFSPFSLILFITGCIFDLAAFIQPALNVMIKDGVEGFSSYMPDNFWWWLFVPGFLLMASGLGMTLFSLSGKSDHRNDENP
jgi:hypothetical protein